MTQLNAPKQREFAVEIVRRLRQRGFVAYWAGGCVRDYLLGRQAKDYDVATSAKPDEIRELFGPRRTIAVGAAFGVIAVVGPRGAGQVEVTTFRRDSTYLDGRHPEHVTFTDAAEDAARRDFTINGLFYDPEVHEVIDYVGGQTDLEAGIVRAIGDPRARFSEDKLRLLRAVRFATTFDFRLDPATAAAVREMAPEIAIVSAERIAQELRRMLVVPGRARGIELLRETDLLATLLPELLSLVGLAAGDEVAVGTDRWQATLTILGQLLEPGFPLALAALLHQVGWPAVRSAGSGDPCEAGAALTRIIGRRLRLAKREIELASWLVRQQNSLAGARKLPWPTLQRRLIHPDIRDLVEFHRAVASVHGASRGDVEHCRKLLELPADELNPPPLLTGDDLIAHGLRPGIAFHGLLDKVRDAQLLGEIGSREEALLLVDRLVGSN
ncbi:MAG: CCA tRNA nucleotidyltransferase [Pirellulales bacterium]|nr:CCA tRNA nucleotidyltransferase [Pirellulales bacterium]